LREMEANSSGQGRRSFETGVDNPMVNGIVVY
jgi:hypothetical protein